MHDIKFHSFKVILGTGGRHSRETILSNTYTKIIEIFNKLSLLVINNWLGVIDWKSITSVLRIQFHLMISRGIF